MRMLLAHVSPQQRRCRARIRSIDFARGRHEKEERCTAFPQTDVALTAAKALYRRLAQRGLIARRGSLVAHFGFERDGNVVARERNAARGGIVARGGCIDVRLGREALPKRPPASGLRALFARKFHADGARRQPDDVLERVEVARPEYGDLPEALLPRRDRQRAPAAAVCQRGVFAPARGRTHERANAARNARASRRRQVAPVCVLDQDTDVSAAREDVGECLAPASRGRDARQLFGERDEFVGSHGLLFGESNRRLLECKRNCALPSCWHRFMKGVPTLLRCTIAMAGWSRAMPPRSSSWDTPKARWRAPTTNITSFRTIARSSTPLLPRP